ncbi:MAG: family 10 glycosylhydrolase [Erysipelotrichales bacterium]|nr:family 10 glycosylhydrolase [Erysipelotrichales bacterium]
MKANIFKKLSLLLFLITITSLVRPTIEATPALVPVPHSSGVGNVRYRGTNVDARMVQTYTEINNQFRGLWVATVWNLDIPRHVSQAQYKQELTAILDNMELWGLNALMYQVRPMNDALYQSNYNHWSTFLANGNNPGWDMLGWLIEETHARGIEFHAWFNPFRVNTNAAVPLSTVVSQAHPNNAASDINNLLMGDIGAFLNPGRTQVRDFVRNVVMEVVRNYNIDAVHFDDYFYRRMTNNILQDPDIATFRHYNNGRNPQTVMEMSNWRREQVNILVRGVKEDIETFNIQNNRAVQFGISPTGIWRNGNSGRTINDPNFNVALGSNTLGQEHFASYLFSDSLYWIQNNLIDYIIPQTYWGFERVVASFADVVSWWTKAVEGSNVSLYVAHGVYMEVGTGLEWQGQRHINELEFQFRYANQFPIIQGHAFFSYRDLRDANPETRPVTFQGLNMVQSTFFTNKVPGAPMMQMNHLPVIPVTNIQANNNGSETNFSWNAVSDARGYIIYRVPLNANFDANQHFYQFVVNNNITFTPSAGFNYFVASVNRANVVSEISQLHFGGNVNVNSIRDYVLHDFSHHIPSSQALPTNNPFGANISWAYQAGQNTAIYNIATGIHSGAVMGAEQRTLIMTVNFNGQVASFPVVINFGALGPEENEFRYANTNVLWGRVAVSHNNNTLYIANGTNFTRITSQTMPIPILSWSSCAVLYLNQTNQVLNFTVNQLRLLQTPSAIYGFIIIRNGQIVEVNNTYTSQTVITLLPGDYLFAPKFLDTQFVGAPFNINRFSVGDSFIVRNFT